MTRGGQLTLSEAIHQLVTFGERDPYTNIDRHQATADRVHAAPCVRCGPSGHPAAVGSPWSAAHQHADALRFLGKQFLKELWIAGRHFPSESHSPDAARHTSDETHTYDAGCE